MATNVAHISLWFTLAFRLSAYLEATHSTLFAAEVGPQPLSQFDEHDESQLQDCRRVGIKFEGYSIRYRYSDHTKKWHTLVRLDADTYKGLKAYLTELATRRSKEELEDMFRSVWFQPYRPVREQLLHIVRVVNRNRKAAGQQPIDWRKSIRQKRRTKSVFREAPSVLSDEMSFTSCVSINLVEY